MGGGGGIWDNSSDMAHFPRLHEATQSDEALFNRLAPKDKQGKPISRE